MVVARWTVGAREEFTGIVATLKRDAPKLAAEVCFQVLKVTRLLEQFPELGQIAKWAGERAGDVHRQAVSPSIPEVPRRGSYQRPRAGKRTTPPMKRTSGRRHAGRRARSAAVAENGASSAKYGHPQNQTRGAERAINWETRTVQMGLRPSHLLYPRNTATRRYSPVISSFFIASASITP